MREGGRENFLSIDTTRNMTNPIVPNMKGILISQTKLNIQRENRCLSSENVFKLVSFWSKNDWNIYNWKCRNIWKKSIKIEKVELMLHLHWYCVLYKIIPNMGFIWENWINIIVSIFPYLTSNYLFLYWISLPFSHYNCNFKMHYRRNSSVSGVLVS